ncbi:MAG: Fur family transcriptional regulator [Thermodesulfobacteriota bacterium]
MNPLKGWQHQFRRHGYRMTSPRQALIDLFSRSTKHLSAKEIYTSIQKSYPAIGLTTVYRTLDLLVKMGVLNKFDFGDGQSRFELGHGIKKDHHHHLICMKCGKIVDYSDFMKEEIELVKKVEMALSKKYNFEIKDHEIQFYGVCNKCQ